MESDERETELRRELRQELKTVEADLKELRATAASLRGQIGDHWFEPTDASERTALITAAEEQEALAETLEARRDELRKLVDRPD
jgi:septal ring factor EnvC (AmiA/AmiB activator)